MCARRIKRRGGQRARGDEGSRVARARPLFLILPVNLVTAALVTLRLMGCGRRAEILPLFPAFTPFSHTLLSSPTSLPDFHLFYDCFSPSKVPQKIQKSTETRCAVF